MKELPSLDQRSTEGPGAGARPLRIAFVQFMHYEYLGIMYLSSCLKRHGHDTQAFIWAGRGKTSAFLEELQRYRPDIAGFSIMTGSEHHALTLARELKRRMKVYTVFGGSHPTAVPDIVSAEGVDAVCLGEAERPLAQIVNLLAAGALPRDVPGAWFRIGGTIVRNPIAPLESDLDVIPRPDRSLYRRKYRTLRTRRAAFITGRGCPYACTFCANPALAALYRGQGPTVRRRSVPDVISEIREVKLADKVTTVNFEDDTFILNRDWVLEFCEVYRREIGVPFSCHIRADLATEELVSALASAGCTTASFGIETGDAGLRERLLRKQLTDEQILGCAGLMKKHGIRIRSLNILGLPGETLEQAWKTVALNARVSPDFPSCSLFQPLPGTELRDYCLTNNLLEKGAADTVLSFFQGSPLILQNKREIINLHRLFYYAVKFPSLGRVVRRAIRCRPNKGYEALFLISRALIYLRYERLSLGYVVGLGIRNLARYFP